MSKEKCCNTSAQVNLCESMGGHVKDGCCILRECYLKTVGIDAVALQGEKFIWELTNEKAIELFGIKFRAKKINYRFYRIPLTNLFLIKSSKIERLKKNAKGRITSRIKYREWLKIATDKEKAERREYQKFVTSRIIGKMTVDEYKTHLDRCNAYHKEIRDARTDDEIKAFRENINAYTKKKMDAMTDDEMKAFRENINAYNKKRMDEMTPDELKAFYAYNNAYRKKKRDAMTADELADYRADCNTKQRERYHKNKSTQNKDTTVK